MSIAWKNRARTINRIVLPIFVWHDLHKLRWGEPMVREPKKGLKSEVLSMRMDPSTRFLVDYIARFRGQSISTVVERAIQEAADRIEIDCPEDMKNKTWKDFWSVSEGIRSLKIWSEKSLYPNYEEQSIVSFANSHWPFFFSTEKKSHYKEYMIDILWPRINEFVEIWNKSKYTDYFKAGRAMREVVESAGVKAPDWPINTVKPTPAVDARPPAQDMDDDIPF